MTPMTTKNIQKTIIRKKERERKKKQEKTSERGSQQINDIQ